ncbi:MAG: tRNA preQ1(34) S-adenosylmethionine ribosyltransferase-isomerase QueA [Eubacteriales bacterium]|nr:tRNA preQ1(34) S-adenosylmethionine ribosyltransferase-isomerase QueA [Eubacteriales bacterium]
MFLSSYYYDLPEELIAQDALEKRDASRMMVLKDGLPPKHLHIGDIADFLNPGDCLVINNSKVIPARLFGHLPGKTSDIECLLIRELAPRTWRCLAKPGRKLQLGRRIIFKENELEAEVINIEEDGARILRFEFEGIWEQRLAELGHIPLPPYIHHDLADPNRYQTVYAKYDGSVAAPTAGLHFTPELLAKIEAKGIRLAQVCLHVGIGTFRPVKEDKITDHQMHTEAYEVTPETAAIINDTKAKGGRVVCVGTTSCRTIETAFDENSGKIKSGLGESQLFIYPGYRFKLMDALLTNFHLPESSLLMLVSAFYGREEILAAYREAVAERYRFYSLGDCMLILGNANLKERD